MDTHSDKIITDHENYLLAKLNEDVLYCRYLNNCEIDLPKAKELVQKGADLMSDKKYYLVVDMREMYGFFDPEVGDFLAKDPEVCTKRIACSILFHSLPIRLLVRSYVLFDKPLNPTKIFKSDEKGLKWLGKMGADVSNIDLKTPVNLI
jgi:hypothetical protein